ncbi:Sucrose transport protein SUT4 [Acorus calamus]|uniref:Sucrose transport protein SUT4 n=1 Tax=Acorus calamus TaxID=4465 RepID=A0AAV9DE04_ACOCL|nr:Sucrose transport protein SUT4 [Acorus calamus]
MDAIVGMLDREATEAKAEEEEKRAMGAFAVLASALGSRPGRPWVRTGEPRGLVLRLRLRRPQALLVLSLTDKEILREGNNTKLEILVFLLFYTFVTLNWAREVPLIAKPAPILSDSAPLLNGAPHSHLDPSSTTFGNPTLVGKTNSKDAFDHELIVKEEANEDFSNGVGSVMVNILTSMRHLPPVMHSVLLIMALNWFKKNILAAIVKGQHPGFKRQRMGTLCKKKKAKYCNCIESPPYQHHEIWRTDLVYGLF